MRIAQIEGNKVHCITPYTSFEEIPPFAPNIIFMEISEDVQEGWILEEGVFKEPEPLAGTQTTVSNEEIKDLLLASMMANLDIYMLIAEQQNKD